LLDALKLFHPNFTYKRFAPALFDGANRSKQQSGQIDCVDLADFPKFHNRFTQNLKGEFYEDEKLLFVNRAYCFACFNQSMFGAG
jgi:hypothetical protein